MKYRFESADFINHICREPGSQRIFSQIKILPRWVEPVFKFFWKSESRARYFFEKLRAFGWYRAVDVDNYFRIGIDFLDLFNIGNVAVDLFHYFLSGVSRKAEHER